MNDETQIEVGDIVVFKGAPNPQYVALKVNHYNRPTHLASYDDPSKTWKDSWGWADMVVVSAPKLSVENLPEYEGLFE